MSSGLKGLSADGSVSSVYTARSARLAKRYGFEFSKTPDVHGGGHDKWYVRGDAVIVPRHAEINELTAKGILKEWDALLAEAQRDVSRDDEGEGK